MSTLYMLSLPVDLGELRRWSAVCGLEADEGRALHHLLCETFGKTVAQPFRLMPGRDGARLASLYAYTGTAEEELRRTAEEAGLPESARILGLTALAVKTMPESWATGRRLAFDVRVRPVMRLMTQLNAHSREAARARPPHRAETYAKGAEVDAFLVARLRASPDGLPEAGGASREEVYRDWLTKRLGAAAAIDPKATRLVSHQRTIALRGGTRLERPDATLHGELTVQDPAAFAKLLAGGVGRHGAYGYGMLLLRPARS
ncbi:MAG: type I-E CRISPR-associated protein Cas6/Cse3/CasE [Hyphomicrobiales bacterium]|jgi:CRISPR system Cascade subunit CasE|nr:type I-E CRISPR-associated protein Cas6/Cse3/CasE [Hyphomicrobiales bacterium]